MDAIFGLHIGSQNEVGTISYRPGGLKVSADRFTIKVHGKGAHGAIPWNSVDPVVTSAQIILGLQTIVSRQTKLIDDAAVVTVATMHAGVRYNVIPAEAELSGTIRALNKATQEQIWAAIRRMAKGIAASAGATAEVIIELIAPITYNDPPLMAWMLPTLHAVAGAEQVKEIKATTGSEDFTFYQEKVPGVFMLLGGMKKGTDLATVVGGHTTGFMLDESGFTLGVKTLATLAADYLAMRK